MPGSQRTSGQWPQQLSGPTVLWQPVPQAGRTNGLVRVTDAIQLPRVWDRLAIIGWSVSLSAALWFQGQQAWGRMGDLYAGLNVGTPMANVNDSTTSGQNSGVLLPQDMSTFMKVFSGPDDSIASTTALDNGFKGQPIGLTNILPAPIVISKDETVQMVLILTAAAGGWIGGATGWAFTVKQASYTIIYGSGDSET